jgi:hypothetical protein
MLLLQAILIGNHWPGPMLMKLLSVAWKTLLAWCWHEMATWCAFRIHPKVSLLSWMIKASCSSSLESLAQNSNSIVEHTEFTESPNEKKSNNLNKTIPSAYLC